MRAFTFHMPTRVIFGRGSLGVVGNEAARLGKRCLLVTGRSFARSSGYLDVASRALTRAGLSLTVFDQVEPNPSLETVSRGAEFAKRDRCDVVVGLGGGSAMDAAKAIAFLSRNDVRLEDHMAPKEVTNPAAPVIAVPTTCGTGSEVTKYAVLTDVTTRKKKVLIRPPLIPRVAVMDASLIDNLPPHLVAYTGFDALSHSFEALLSRNSNNVSDAFATESIVSVGRSLGDAYKGNPESRERTFYGSMLAGVAIDTTGTVILHGMGYYLTNYHNVHHGLANAMLLTHVLRFEGACIKEKLERIALNMGLGDFQGLIDYIESLANDVGIPNDLTELGVGKEELDAMVKDVLSYARNLEANPIEVSASDIRKLYEQAFRGKRTSQPAGRSAEA